MHHNVCLRNFLAQFWLSSARYVGEMGIRSVRGMGEQTKALLLPAPFTDLPTTGFQNE
jgi:hypothetical protein